MIQFDSLHSEASLGQLLLSTMSLPSTCRLQRFGSLSPKKKQRCGFQQIVRRVPSDLSDLDSQMNIFELQLGSGQHSRMKQSNCFAGWLSGRPELTLFSALRMPGPSRPRAQERASGCRPTPRTGGILSNAFTWHTCHPLSLGVQSRSLSGPLALGA